VETFSFNNSTIKDVAARADVSIATVSRALNNPDTIKPETLKRIQNAITELNYRRNDQARSLKAKQSKLVGVLIPDILNPFFARIVRGVENFLNQNDFTAIICDSEEDSFKEERYISRLLEQRIEGLIFIPAHEKSIAANYMAKSKIPTVYIDRYISNEIDSVKCNNFSGISLLVAQFIKEGYTKIASIAGPLNTLPGRERYDAFLQVMKNNGLNVNKDYLKISDFSMEGGFKEAKALLSMKSPPEAIIVHNNTMAIGALRAIKQMGLKIPSQIAISAFDEVNLYDLMQPSLTIVIQPAEEMGKVAAKMLINRMSGKLAIPAQEIIFEPNLIVGESTINLRIHDDI